MVAVALGWLYNHSLPKNWRALANHGSTFYQTINSEGCRTAQQQQFCAAYHGVYLILRLSELYAEFP